MRRWLLSSALGYAAGALLVLAAVGTLSVLPGLTVTARALVLLTIVFLTARIWESGPGVAAAVLATLALNFFFFPPFHTFTVEDPANVVALFVFLAAALVIGRLSALSRLRLRQLEAERGDLLRLTRLSQEFFADTNRESLLAVAADRLRRALEARCVAMLLPDEEGRLREAASSGEGEIRADLAELAFRQGNSAAFPSPSGGIDLYLPVPLGVSAVGALAASSARASERMAEGCAILLGLALERERFVRVARMGEEARARDEMKSTFLAAMAHELKTPVATARAAIENWEAESGSTEASRLAAESVDRLSRRTSELLEIVRLEAGLAHPRRERVSGGAIAEAAVARFGHLLAGHNFSVDVAPAPAIEVDPAQVTEAVGLGLENAARHCPPGRDVRFSVFEEGGKIVFRVDDAGPGIPEADRTRVLEKFVRLPSAGQVPGSGLGLYLARSLAELNDGRIDIGQAPGGGARFDAVFPAAA
jgi:two-component system sensor histidine kinase KdpD